MKTLIQAQQNFAQLMRESQSVGDDFSTSNVAPNVGLYVYRNNLKLAWRNALKATFPVLTQLLGDAGMALLCKDYLVQHPSQSGDLNDLGEYLADFIHDYEPLLEYPYLPDVTSLEWQVHRAQTAANHTPLQLTDLLAHGADEWLAAKVDFAPSAAVLKFGHAAATIWLAHQPDGNLIALQSSEVILQPEYILLSRPIWRIELRVLDTPTYVFLTQLHKGASFEQALEHLEQHDLALDFTNALPMLIESGAWASILIKD